MHHRLARIERAIHDRHSLNEYESTDHITEQIKRVVPRKGKGVEKKKGKTRILYQSYKFNKLCIC